MFSFLRSIHLFAFAIWAAEIVVEDSSATVIPPVAPALEVGGVWVGIAIYFGFVIWLLPAKKLSFSLLLLKLCNYSFVY